MIPTVRLIGNAKLIARIEAMPASVAASLLRKVYSLALKLENYIKQNKLSGQVLNRKSGRLMRSIANKVEQTGQSIYGIVFQSADVPYGGIHEFGGKTAPHVIVPKKASVLAFNWKGKNVFFKRVNHPGSHFPERSYMRSALRDMSTEISLGLKAAVVEGLKQAK